MMKATTVYATAVAMGFGLASAQADEVHPVYGLLPDSSLSGLINPHMEDRGAINKALPKTPKDPNNIRIGWTEITLGNPWFVGLVEGAKERADEYGGYTIDVQVADGDPLKTSAHVDAFIAQGVDVIVIDPTDLAGSAADAERAVEAGIPVVGLGTVMDDFAPLVTTVLANPYGNGFEVGIYTADHIGKDTAIVAGSSLGTVGNSTSESRINGMISGIVFERSNQFGLGMSREDAALKGFELFQELKKSGSFNWADGQFEVVGMGVGYWTEEGGLAAAEDLLVAHGDRMNLFIAENDFMGIGTVTALENAGLQDQIEVISAADGFKEALTMVKDGKMLITGKNSGRATGQGVIDLIQAMFRDGYDANNLPLGSYFPSEIITADVVDDIWTENPDNYFFEYDVPAFQSIPQIKAAAQ